MQGRCCLSALGRRLTARRRNRPLASHPSRSTTSYQAHRASFDPRSPRNNRFRPSRCRSSAFCAPGLSPDAQVSTGITFPLPSGRKGVLLRDFYRRDSSLLPPAACPIRLACPGKTVGAVCNGCHSNLDRGQRSRLTPCPPKSLENVGFCELHAQTVTAPPKTQSSLSKLLLETSSLKR